MESRIKFRYDIPCRNGGDRPDYKSVVTTGQAVMNAIDVAHAPVGVKIRSWLDVDLTQDQFQNYERGPFYFAVEIASEQGKKEDVKPVLELLLESVDLAPFPLQGDRELFDLVSKYRE